MNKPQLIDLLASKATLQFGFHKGIREFGDNGREVTKQETVTMVKSEELEKDICLNLLKYLIFLKIKRTGKVEAHGCADLRT